MASRPLPRLLTQIVLKLLMTVQGILQVTNRRPRLFSPRSVTRGSVTLRFALVVTSPLLRQS